MNKRKMNKKFLIAPLAFSLVVPTAAFADSGEQHHEMNHQNKAAAASQSTATPAAELRITLDTALTEHAFLAVEAMRKGADGAKDFDQTAAALMANSDDIAAAVSSVYGDEAGKQFLDIWNSHINYLVDYVKATGAGDAAAKQAALDKLEEYKKEQAAFFATATEDRLPESALVEGLSMHLNQLVGAFDAYTAGDFETAYTHEREAIHHMSMFAETLSVVIAGQFPDKFKNSNPDTPAIDLRSQLNSVFTEHAGLAAMAMQDGADGAKSFEQAAAALTANADDLSAAVASVYGEEAGAQFSKIWNSHIGYFVDYVKATGTKDAKAQEAAKADLDEYIKEQAAFLDTATQGRVPAADLEEGLTMHVDQLLRAFDSYVAGDYETAYSSIREAYAHMSMPAAGLSAAIVDQFPDKFSGEAMPKEMPQTGLGGSQSNMPYMWLLAGLLLASITTVAALRFRKQS
ncbi:copper amine oxidase [Domibacillus sp. DTU_2020_1001157_1_SI_ALB_TIR_016]|uniref:copper amine oxidase n=1 Tax=Domibacillus sp. DTU_2020_1001157_1_SI_ALB_TIR_016 TaxID=3077789 RepID=UPI0028E9C75A|nr:copper amine oxidase [Domibacillus sp. DTU_2020_1001157_1_SI_ALB_TIR_016]WNS80651.1 copper amine oxidase [Domibacillus sp. DTU_2020_1001157_1_SI_ALB_TIR_016]